MYTQEEIEDKFSKICKSILEGNSLRLSLKENSLSAETFYKWTDSDDNRAKRYARACDLRSELLFDEILEISDNTEEGTVIETDDSGRTKEKVGDMLGHRKLKIDARKWVLSKMNPKKYSDKLQVDNSEFSEQPLFPDVPTDDSNK